VVQQIIEVFDTIVVHLTRGALTIVLVIKMLMTMREMRKVMIMRKMARKTWMTVDYGVHVV